MSVDSTPDVSHSDQLTPIIRYVKASEPIEPYFLVISLFDVKNARKISEDFRTMIDIKGKIQGSPKVPI